MKDDPALKLSLQTDIGKVPVILDMVQFMFSQYPEIEHNRDLQFTIELVVAEACTNVIRHAYPEDRPGILELEIDIRDNTIHIEVADYGQSFDPFSLPEPDPASPKTGGYGVFIIKNSMDTFDYRPDNGRNSLRLTKAVE
jgi:anti-sigma regulatory factor (Ser/Thr protein kinase)